MYGVREILALTIDDAEMAELAPKAGDVATMHAGSDCYPYIVVKATRCTVHAVPLETYRGPRETGVGAEKFTRRADGRWRAAGCTTYGRLTIGCAAGYLDPSF